jgi:hypothetical protein
MRRENNPDPPPCNQSCSDDIDHSALRLVHQFFVLNHYWTARLAKLREVHYSGVRKTLLEKST